MLAIFIASEFKNIPNSKVTLITRDKFGIAVEKVAKQMGWNIERKYVEHPPSQRKKKDMGQRK